MDQLNINFDFQTMQLQHIKFLFLQVKWFDVQKTSVKMLFVSELEYKLKLLRQMPSFLS